MSKSMDKITRAAAEAAAVGDLAKMRRSPTHPGEIFREDFRLALEPKLSQTDAAKRLGWTINRLNEFERGKRGITPENAVMLAKLTGASAEFWMTLQMRYDLWHAMQETDTSHIKAIA